MLIEYDAVAARRESAEAFLKSVLQVDGGAYQQILESLLAPGVSAWVVIVDGEIRAVVGARLRHVQVGDPDYPYMPPSYALAPLSMWHLATQEDASCVPGALEHITRDAAREGIHRVSIDVPIDHAPMLEHVLQAGYVPDVLLAGRSSAPRPAPIPPGTRIRRAGPHDVEALVHLTVEEAQYHAEHTRSGILAAQDLGPTRELVATWVEPGALLPTFVAEQGGEVVGMMPLVPADGEEPGNEGYAYIASTSVTARARRQGIAAALLAHVLDAARNAGIPAVVLHYVADNPSASALWENAGFVPLTVTLTKMNE